MLVSNAINVAVIPDEAQEAQASDKPDIKETIEEVEQKSRTNRWVRIKYRKNC